MKRLLFFLFASLPLTIMAQTLTVDAADVKARIPSLIYGAGAEDVNHEIYGGLYDQRIFGEGFEEPSLTNVKDFTFYDNNWSMSGDILQIVTSGFGKIIYNSSTLQQGVVDVDIRLDSANPIAGILFNVSSPSNGADAFDGYEVSLNARTKTLVYGKHVNNWQQIADKSVTFNPSDWNNLRISFNGAQATVFLNNTEVFTYNDTSSPLTNGKIGLRSYGGSASYKNLKINNNSIAFVAQLIFVNGFMQYDNSWSIADSKLQLVTDGFGKIVYQGKVLDKGSVEVEMHLDGTRSIAGLIYHVGEAGNGADNFRGYEVSLDTDDKAFVFGKHDHNWQAVANKPLSFNSINTWLCLRYK